MAANEESFDELLQKYRENKSSRQGPAATPADCCQDTRMDDYTHGWCDARAPQSNSCQGSPDYRSSTFAPPANPRVQRGSALGDVPWSTILKYLIIVVAVLIAGYILVNVAMALWGMRGTIINAVTQLLVYAFAIGLAIYLLKSIIKR